MLIAKCAYPSIQCYLEKSRFYWKIARENSISRKIISRWLNMRTVLLFLFCYLADFSSWGVANQMSRFVSEKL
jgi:hypothetical protein